MKRSVVPVIVHGITPCCKSLDCPYRKDCANHTSAGDYRFEEGLKPDLRKIDGEWSCSMSPYQHLSGAVLIEDVNIDNELLYW